METGREFASFEKRGSQAEEIGMRITHLFRSVTTIYFFTVVMCYAVVVKGPYLIYPGEGTGPSMKILWQLDDSSTKTCLLEISEENTFQDDTAVFYSVDVNSLPTDPDFYACDLSGVTLSAGEKYYYRISEEYEENSASPGGYAGDYHFGSFRTAPDANTLNVKFLAYADIRRDYRKFYANEASDHDSVCKAIVETYTNDPNYQTFVIHAGDWVTSDNEYFWQNEYFNKSNINAYKMRANLPIQGCTGNHDVNASQWGYESSRTGNNNEYSKTNPGDFGTTCYEKYWPYYQPLDPNGPDPNARCWSFDYGPVHVAILDQYSEEFRSGNNPYSWNFGRLNSDNQVSEQYEWLKKDLLDSDAAWNIVVMHEPAWSAGDYQTPPRDNNDPDIQDLFYNLHDEGAEIDLVINGHNHYYARCVDEDGLSHLTIGGGGGKLFDPRQDAERLIVAPTPSKFHFGKIDITGSELNFKAVDADDLSNILDDFTLTKKESGHWRLNGNARDSSGNGFTGTIYGTQSWVDGEYGQALEFNGSDTYVETGDSFDDVVTSQGKTIMAWVKSDTTDYLTNGSGRILSLYRDSGSTGLSIYAYGNPAKWYGGYVDTNGTFRSLEGSDVGDQWTHLALVQEGTAISLYIDDALVKTANDAGTITLGTSVNADIGAFDQDGANDMNRFFQGAIDDVRVIHQNGPIAFWRMDEDSSDAMGNHDSTIYDGDVVHPSPGWVDDDPNYLGTELSLDGINDYVDASSVCSAVADGDVTVSAWVRSAMKSSNQFICAFNTATGANRLLFGQQASNPNLCVYDNGGWIDSDTVVFDNEWHKVAFVLSKERELCTLLVDGVSVYSYSTTTLIDSQDQFSIGQEYDGLVKGDFFEGFVNDIRVYNKAVFEN